ncbi:MAG: hypothetical protein GWN99_19980 [Gemmatimonadetes bacterium]|uniref:Uncharacterized protein n=1 Tax=Candidatus Kutchimonas denitrificans TaxID=3056748 RepID=A0AAE5CD28_9BACT|nr:hypothetical protein [Gemmatimonadota bacterium]NIR76485.1 hypothetical protein [Candidatus Kutchimonas denitrificans]NIS03303.1 hypothetical protein [Gemmatimonadota bacterium]NIT69164.1 hypothetical protein [Gemmatimonadota bacterium]NIU54556.1 hypothetical protein [Gemmatimonadota bacterium]
MPRSVPLLAVMLAAGVTACAGPTVTLPPVAPEDVEVIPQGEEPEQEYREIAPVRQQGTMDTPRTELVRLAREKAARLGADALMIEEYRLNTSYTNPTITLLALAVYYPARHPELTDNPDSR